MAKKYEWNEIVELMYGKELNYIDCQIVDVIYSLDKARRYVIVKDENGYLTFGLEKIELDDEDTLDYFPPSDEPPAYWTPEYHDSGTKSIFDDMKNLMRELKSQPEYKTYFEKNQDEE